MLNSLDKRPFFTDDELARLRTLGLWDESRPSPQRLAFAGLMLCPIMMIVVHDSATTAAEFETVVAYIRTLQREFELASREEIEGMGTDMGLLPMVRGSWTTAQFLEAREILAAALNRFSEPDAHAVRNAISKAALAVARAGSPYLISLHMLDKEERDLIMELIKALDLDKCAEGLHLLEKSSEA